MIAGTDMKTKRELSRKQQKTISIASFCTLLLMLVLLCAVIGRPMVRFASDPDKFRDWVEGHGVWGMLAYMGMVAVQVLAALIPGEPLEIAGGYAFGAWAGTALCLLGAVLGSVTVFTLVRRWGRGLVEVFFPADKLEKLHFLLHTSPKRTALFWLIFTVPGTPKDLLCYFAGLTDLPWGTWLLIATVGRLPSIVTSTVGGSALGEQNYRAAVIAFALALAVAGVGYVIYRAVCRRHGQKPDNTKTDG